MDWDKLRVFHAVAEVGSLTHAGDILHLSQSAVSRQIRGLEISLSATLFHRHARGLILTEQGELLFEATKVMTSKLDSATARIRDAKDEALGELRVTSTVGFGTLFLTPRLGALYEKYPDLSIDLLLNDHLLDLPMREADVAIRMKEPSQADLIRRKLLDVRIRFYASPQYIEKYGVPKSADDLIKHRLVAQRQDDVQVQAGAEFLAEYLAREEQLTLYVNSYYAILNAVLSHVGIGALPNYLTADEPNLVRVLPELESKTIPVYLAYPSELRNSKRVSVFRDFVLSEISAYQEKVED